MFSLMKFENDVIKNLRKNNEILIGALEEIAKGNINLKSNSIDFEIVIDEMWINILVNPEINRDSGIIEEYSYNQYFNGYKEIVSKLEFYDDSRELQQDNAFNDSVFLDKLCDNLEDILIKWFIECSKATNLVNINLPITIGIHDGYKCYKIDNNEV